MENSISWSVFGSPLLQWSHSGQRSWKIAKNTSKTTEFASRRFSNRGNLLLESVFCSPLPQLSRGGRDLWKLWKLPRMHLLNIKPDVIVLWYNSTSSVRDIEKGHANKRHKKWKKKEEGEKERKKMGKNRIEAIDETKTIDMILKAARKRFMASNAVFSN